jgi:5-methylcytosine-specific restriction protein A
VKLTTLKPRITPIGKRLATTTGTWRQPDESSTKRGYGYKWQQARIEYLTANPYCVYCLRKRGITTTEPLEQLEQAIEQGGLPTRANVVDHRTPHRGDQKLFWDRKNWQGLCASCHSSTKQREEASAEADARYRAG